MNIFLEKGVHFLLFQLLIAKHIIRHTSAKTSG